MYVFMNIYLYPKFLINTKGTSCCCQCCLDLVVVVVVVVGGGGGGHHCGGVCGSIGTGRSSSITSSGNINNICVSKGCPMLYLAPVYMYKVYRSWLYHHNKHLKPPDGWLWN